MLSRIYPTFQTVEIFYFVFSLIRQFEPLLNIALQVYYTLCMTYRIHRNTPPHWGDRRKLQWHCG